VCFSSDAKIEHTPVKFLENSWMTQASETHFKAVLKQVGCLKEIHMKSQRNHHLQNIPKLKFNLVWKRNFCEAHIRHKLVNGDLPL